MNRSQADRAAAALSGCKWTGTTCILIDCTLVRECEQAGIFLRKKTVARRKASQFPGLSQWIYNCMAQALREKRENMQGKNLG